jgi:hypothetical protein
MRKSKAGKGGANPKAVHLEISFWLKPDNSIHVTCNDPAVETFHVAVRDDAAKASGHPMLYRELAKCLRQMGVPAPAENSN